MKRTKKLKRETGITLIALVVTIVVLLILAGISINAVLGDNGLITRARDAKIEQAHAQVKDAVTLLYGDWEVEVFTGGKDSFSEYLISNRITDEEEVVDVKALLGGSLSYGNGTGTSDVYKIEDLDGYYDLNYYDEKGTVTRLQSFLGYGSDTSSKLEPGLYETGTQIMISNWDELKEAGDIVVENGVLVSISNEIVGDLVISDEIQELSEYASTYPGVPSCGGSTLISGITGVYIPSSVKEIPYIAFYGSNIQRIVLEEGIETIADYAFMWCNNLVEITIPSSVTSIGKYAFNGCTGLTSVIIPSSVTSIGVNAFSGCTSLASATIPNSVTSIEVNAFSGCTGLTEITIPSSVTSIGDSAFSGCTGLTSVTIPNSVTRIDSYAFSGCTGLTSVSIPDSVTSIGEGAFYSCTGLTSVSIPDSVTRIGSLAFSGTEWYNNQPDGDIYVGKTYYDYKGEMQEGTEIVIRDGTTQIVGYAFSSCKGLTSVTIPDSVTSIGSSAFSGCSGLTSITIPDSVTSIGSSAFDGCTGLTSVTIPDSVTSIERRAFDGCTGLTSVTISLSVTSIGDFAFYNCSGLQNVYYAGNEEDWKLIDIGSFNTSFENATRTYEYVPSAQ